MEQLGTRWKDYRESLQFSIFRKKMSRKFRFHQNRARIMFPLHEGQYTFLVISRSLLLRLGNISGKSCGENQNKHLMFKLFFSKIVPFMS
jgi:hypothetical protein